LASEEEQDAYTQRTHRDYFSTYEWPSGDEGDSAKQQSELAFSRRPNIFTGFGIYADMQRRLLSPIHAERESIRTYEKLLSEQFFPGLPVTLTPALHGLDAQGKSISNDVVYLKIGYSEDRPIYDLGDGMQSLIICTYPIITELNKGSLFFIEEPDLGMHPSLQRVFLNVLREYHRKKGHQFFLTTHSNHLLDLLEDDPLVSIFSFSSIESEPAKSSEDTETSAQETTPAQARFRIRPASQRDRQVLSQLGVRPSATYLANATIWVEGTSDGSYLRAYLNAFIAYLELRGNKTFKAVATQLKRYKEDRHYAFVEYNGSNLVHFNFDEEEEDSDGRSATASKIKAASLCAQALVIADGDIAGKANRAEVFAGQLRDRFVLLPVKEIENLIPQEAVHRQVYADRTRKRPDSNNWPTSCDGLLYKNYSARNGSVSNKPNHGLGSQLEKRRFSGYKAKSGTLKPGDKARWASQDNGIPMHINQMIREHADNKTNVENEQSQQLPPYLNQDLIWLCVVIFAHVARLNHDDAVANSLDAFKTWIKIKHASKTLSNSDTPSADRHEPNHEHSEIWPIPDPSSPYSQDCLLSQYLSQGQ